MDNSTIEKQLKEIMDKLDMIDKAIFNYTGLMSRVQCVEDKLKEAEKNNAENYKSMVSKFYWVVGLFVAGFISAIIKVWLG